MFQWVNKRYYSTPFGADFFRASLKPGYVYPEIEKLKEEIGCKNQLAKLLSGFASREFIKYVED